jgi:hypothetical protein
MTDRERRARRPTISVQEREVGQRLTAEDIKDRLIQEGDPKTLLMWPPNLFAFTSYILGLSGAYQLAVSPPSNLDGDGQVQSWPPDISLITEMLASAESTTTRAEALAIVKRGAIVVGWMHDPRSEFPVERRERLWNFLVRECAQEWRLMLSREKDIRAYYDILLKGRVPTKRKGAAQYTPPIPALLLGCWEAFRTLCYAPPTPWDISHLLCNGDSVGAGGPAPPALKDCWLSTVALLSMHAIADETCVGWGIHDSGPSDPLELWFPSEKDLLGVYRDLDTLGSNKTARRRFRETFAKPGLWAEESAAQRWAEGQRLREHGTLATINPYRARVLPKRHNPDVGITLRSISSNLAFHRSAIDVVWIRDQDIPLIQHEPSPLADRMRLGARSEAGNDRISVLLLPLPLEIKSGHFVPWNPKYHPAKPIEPYGFFTYASDQNDAEVVEQIIAAVRKAQTEVGTVDIVVLPEVALSQTGVHLLDAELSIPHSPNHDPVSFYIAGVASENSLAAFPQDNAVHFKSLIRQDDGVQFPPDDQFGDAAKYRQHKHHRWQLNRSQLLQYGLTHKLSEERKWWEAINVGKRRVSFINIGERLTICPLICEDLARQDPIADLIRHVGPSLVVTILMDGPQHRDRWASRYAGILSEDPGSAVIALTSFGMVRRWSAAYRSLSRIVALWNDQSGPPRELELEQGATGILLSIRVTEERESMADGRLELHATSSLSLIDVMQISVL